MRAVKQNKRLLGLDISLLEKTKGVIFHKNGWVALLMTLSVSVYAHAVQQKKQVIEELDTHLSSLKKEKDLAIHTQEDLILQINSQSDPAWIELVLKKRLGLVPEGQSKVYFYEDSIIQ